MHGLDAQTSNGRQIKSHRCRTFEQHRKPQYRSTLRDIAERTSTDTLFLSVEFGSVPASRTQHQPGPQQYGIFPGCGKSTRSSAELGLRYDDETTPR